VRWDMPVIFVNKLRMTDKCQSNTSLSSEKINIVVENEFYVILTENHLSTENYSI
jgi:hypothetical protein